MELLDKWLGLERGCATKLAAELRVARSRISQVRKGKAPIPTNWMPTIQRFTKGAVSIEAMVLDQARSPALTQKRKRRKSQ